MVPYRFDECINERELTSKSTNLTRMTKTMWRLVTRAQLNKFKESFQTLSCNVGGNNINAKGVLHALIPYVEGARAPQTRTIV